jgi:cytochrome c-type biogenesis protein CcsB
MLKRSFEILISVLFLLLAFSPVFAAGFDFSTLAHIPIQEGGRVKPLDTFARESVRFITSHEAFEGRGSLNLVMDWITHPKEWESKNFILLDNLELKSYLNIPKDQRRVSPGFLRGSDAFYAFANTSYSKQDKKMTLNPEEKEVLAVAERLQRFSDIESGNAWTLIPIPDPKTQKWASIGDIYRAYQLNPKSVPEAAQAVLGAYAGVLKAFDGNDAGGFAAESRDLAEVLARIGGPGYADKGKINLEVQFNAVDPFLWAWGLHLMAFLLIGTSFYFKERRVWNRYFLAGMAFFALGIALSLYGIVARCIIAGRPPVSNMYEVIIWVTFGMTVFTLIFEAVYKARFFALAGSLLAVLGFVLADNVPTVLDSSIQPLEPVLRSNFWLTIHVLTITLSYAAFLLSLGVAHVCLWSVWKYPQDKERLKKQVNFLYRVVQVGVVLIAAGTILGGVWANYSWGRFWGWDPKETWALIALLGYVAVLHGRLAGWLKDAGFALAVVIAFFGPLMACYGVNFILGVGLHSYGFSKGGLAYVIAFVVTEILLVAVTGLKVRMIKSAAT